MTNTTQKRSNIETMYPLSPMQEGLLFHSLLSPAAGTYIPQIVLSFSGELDGQLLKQAWEEAIARHSILRTGFYWEQRDQPFQVVYRKSGLSQAAWQNLWIEQDWQQLSEVEQSAKLKILLACNQTEPFNLNQPPLMRLTWIRSKDDTGKNRYYLIWCYHHLVLDGWSASQLLKEVFQTYFVISGKIPPINQPVSRAYGDYIAWLNQQDAAKAESFWQSYLSGWDEPIPLPIINHKANSAKNGLVTEQLTEQQRPLSAKATQKLKAFAQTHKVTLNTVVQAALGLVLSRYCDTPDVVFGATCAGRPTALAGALSMVGLFINTLPVRVQIEREETIVDWLQKLSIQQAVTTEYEYVSLRSLQATFNDGNSLFDTLLVFESYPVSVESFNGQTDFQLENIQFNEWTHFPLTILVSGEDQLTFTAKYRADQLSLEAVSRLLGHLNNVITAFVKKPTRQLKDISLLCSVEKKQIADWNRTAVDSYPLDKSLPDLFEAQVEKTPRAAALIFKDQTLTYQALNEQANQLAHSLQEAGIGPEQRVAVYMERSLEMALALLAIVKAGAAYVPSDPSYPEDRIQYMLEDADVSAVLKDIPETSDQPTHNPKRTLHPQSSAYVIYTSGSTGKPKGVINTHQGIVNRLCWMQQTYNLTIGQRILHKTPLSFDVSVWEIFWPLLNGATLVIAKPDGHKDSTYLTELIQTQKITVSHFVPSMLAAFLEAPNANSCTSLKHVICSGETLPPALQNQFFTQLPNTALHNLYGPTEAAIDVTAWQCQPNAKTVPIGHPIANIQIHLLDSDLHPVPIGVPGELHIGGVGVARGYFNKPALTSERFIPIPQSPNPPIPYLYKTGDLARYLPDGAIEYLGRRDNQVKLRGVRIELGEIEAALIEHRAIRQSVVLIRNEHLVAYIVGNLEVLTDLKQTLTAFLKPKLPDVMVPTRYVPLKELPLTPNGKLDRRALPNPEKVENRQRVLPRNETEHAIASIWLTVLSIEDDIGIHDNFFDLGGHSLTATRVNTRLRKHFHLELPLQSAFEHPTIASLATHIDALTIATAPPTTRSTESTKKHKEIEL
ncbi:MAG: amino acid adenylation domain-containing protein [Cyanobacteria bacterium J06634_6]